MMFSTKTILWLLPIIMLVIDIYVNLLSITISRGYDVRPDFTKFLGPPLVIVNILFDKLNYPGWKTSSPSFLVEYSVYSIDDIDLCKH